VAGEDADDTAHHQDDGENAQNDTIDRADDEVDNAQNLRGHRSEKSVPPE
jgi:hypothetical protein